jgi:hypothetical protein
MFALYFKFLCWQLQAQNIASNSDSDTKDSINPSRFAVFSLEPLAQDPRESEITDMRYVNLFTPLPLRCSALTEA